MVYNKYQSYLAGLGEVITEDALDAKRKNRVASEGVEKDFSDGYLAAYYRIITLMQQCAEPYDISLVELGLSDISEGDLL